MVRKIVRNQSNRIIKRSKVQSVLLTQLSKKFLQQFQEHNKLFHNNILLNLFYY